MTETSASTLKERRKAWAWIPSLYFAEGIPYVLVMTVSVVMYKRLDISNADIALYTSWLYLPWVIKPLWSPIVDLFGTKRAWITGMQLLVGAALAGVAFTIPMDAFFQWSLAALWLVAFSSATHDIAADGFYMLAMDDANQSWFVGIRSTFYRLAMITGQGLLVVLAGWLEVRQESVQAAWATTFGIVAAGFLLLMAWHRFLLPRPALDGPTAQASGAAILSEFMATFVSFFRKPKIGVILAFLLLYRFAEAQLAKMAAPFLLDPVDAGGLALSTAQVGFVYGTVGVLALTFGGILGGIVVARKGLKYWLWWMAVAINVPNAVYIFLSWSVPASLLVVNAAVAVEQFGYGFGFTAYMMYMIYVADGPHKTAHFALCTGFMALGMMLPGMVSGWVQETLGYNLFFVYVLLATIPGFLVTAFIPLRASFGRGEQGHGVS